MAAGGGGVCERSCIKARSADHTILALFFQSSRFREGNHSRAGDRKHMSADSRRGTQNTGLRARRPNASVENITVCGAHMVALLCHSCICMFVTYGSYLLVYLQCNLQLNQKFTYTWQNLQNVDYFIK